MTLNEFPYHLLEKVLTKALADFDKRQAEKPDAENQEKEKEAA